MSGVMTLGLPTRFGALSRGSFIRELIPARALIACWPRDSVIAMSQEDSGSATRECGGDEGTNGQPALVDERHPPNRDENYDTLLDDRCEVESEGRPPPNRGVGP